MKHMMDEEQHSSALICRTILRKLCKKSAGLTSWDLIEIVKILKILATSKLIRTSTASDIADSMLKITSELLRPALTQIWNEIAVELQVETAATLISNLEAAAFFLARDMISTGDNLSKKSNKVTWSQHYATLAIRIESVSKVPTNVATAFKSALVTLRSGHGDDVVVSDSAIMDLLGAKHGDKLVMVHLSLKTLGNSFVDESGQYLVNSQVFTLSAKLMDRSGSWSPLLNGSVALRRPVSLHFHHKKHHLKYHVCAFWNQTLGPHDGFWSRAGCIRVSGNSSYSICECDHLASFVILSSDDTFPLMGAEEPELRSLSNITFINVIRGGMIVSLVFLLITLSALLLVKKQSDATTIRKNLLISMILAQLIFLAGLTQTSHVELCTFVAASLFYAVLIIFTWAALLAVDRYVAQNIPEERRNYWKYYYLIGYGGPALVVGSSMAADFSAFQNQSICWMRMSDNFVWFFIAPCLLTVLTALGLIVTALLRLSGSKTSSKSNFIKRMRSEIATSCVIMFLICAEWASSFMWISGFLPNLTAWLVSVFSCFCGIVPFVLFTVLSPEIFLCCECFVWGKRKQNMQTSRHHLPPRHFPPLIRDHPFSFPHSFHHENVALLHASHQQSVPCMKTTASAGEADEPRSDIVPERNISNLQSSSFVCVDVTDPKLPVDPHPLCIRPSWNDYVQGASRTPDEEYSSTNPRCTRHRRSQRCPQCRNERGTLPFVSNTTCNSCCYDHLHEQMMHKQDARHDRRETCNTTQGMENHLDVDSVRRCSSHLYETLGSLPDVQNAVRGQVQGFNMHNRHPYEDVKLVSDSPCNHLCDHVSSGMNPRVYSQLNDNPHHNDGRTSDPLSTDQGYDTDSQQPIILPNYNFNREEISRQNVVRILSTVNSVNEERSSSSLSECGSENDREVRIINSSRNCSDTKPVFNPHNTAHQSPSLSHDGDDTPTTSRTLKRYSASDHVTD